MSNDSLSRPLLSSSDIPVGRDFTDAVLDVGGSDEGNGGGNDNDAAS
jgi:hypothetical protein